MNRMRDSLPWLEQQGWTQEVEAIRHLLRFRQEAAGAALRVTVDVENIEDLFSLVAASNDKSLEADIVQAIGATLSFAERAASPEGRLRVSQGFPTPDSWTREGDDVVR